MSEFGSLADGWNSSRIECERIMEGMHRVHPYTGVLPAVVIVPGAGFASFRRLPIYRRVCDDCKPLGALERTLMQDVVQMCMRVLNGGFVMCASPDSRRDDPDAIVISDPGYKL